MFMNKPVAIDALSALLVRRFGPGASLRPPKPSPSELPRKKPLPPPNEARDAAPELAVKRQKLGCFDALG